MSDFIRIKNLKVFRDQQTICDVPNLMLTHGQRLLIRGGNGSGKTTLLRVLGRLTKSFAGTVEVDAPKREIVFVHQNPLLFRGTVLFNATYGLTARVGNRTEGERQATHWLRKFGVDQLADAQAGDLSGGEVRRVSLARAFAIQPKLLLLDEPFAELDDKGCQALLSAIEESADTTVIFTSPIAIRNMDQFSIFDIDTTRACETEPGPC